MVSLSNPSRIKKGLEGIVINENSKSNRSHTIHDSINDIVWKARNFKSIINEFPFNMS